MNQDNPITPQPMVVDLPSPVTPMATPTVNLQPMQPTAVVPVKKKSSKVFILIALIFLIGIVAVVVAFLLLNKGAQVNTTITNNTNTVSYTTETTPTNTLMETPSSYTSSDTVYKQVAPEGWTVYVELDGDVAFALPAQDSYAPKAGPAILSDDQLSYWYVSKPTNSMNSDNTIQIYKTPDQYDRSNFACGIGCVDESFITITKNASTQTSDQLYEKLKADADATDAEPNSYYSQNPGTDPSIISSEKVTMWGQDVVKYFTRAGGDNPERFHYVLGTGKNAYYIDYYSTNNDADAQSVFESLIFQ